MDGACLDSSEQLALPLAASRMCCAVLAFARAAEKATEVEQCLAVQGYECPPNLRIV